VNIGEISICKAKNHAREENGREKYIYASLIHELHSLVKD